MICQCPAGRGCTAEAASAGCERLCLPRVYIPIHGTARAFVIFNPAPFKLFVKYVFMTPSVPELSIYFTNYN